MTDFFANAGSIDARGGNDKILPGIYDALRVEGAKIVQGHHGARFILEMTVLTEGREREPGVAPSPVGASVSWGCKIDGQYAQIGLAEAKNAIAILHGMTADQANAMGQDFVPLMKETVGPTNPSQGTVISGEFWYKTTGQNRKMVKCALAPSEHKDEAPTSAAAAQAAPPPPAEASAPAVPEGYFPFSTPDSRGTHYNAAGDIITVA